MNYDQQGQLQVTQQVALRRYAYDASTTASGGGLAVRLLASETITFGQVVYVSASRQASKTVASDDTIRGSAIGVCMEQSLSAGQVGWFLVDGVGWVKPEAGQSFSSGDIVFVSRNENGAGQKTPTLLTDYNARLGFAVYGTGVADQYALVLLRVPGLSGISSALSVGADYLHGIYSGLTQDSFTFNATDHTLTVKDAHVYYYKGVVKSQLANVVCDLDTYTLSTGLWYIGYNDATGTLSASKSLWSLFEAVPVCMVHWNGTGGRVMWEGHGARRDLNWHANAHVYIGALISASDYADTAPSVGSPATINIAGGTLADEDISTTHTAHTSAVVWYQDSASTFSWATSSAVYGSSVRRVDPTGYVLTAVEAAKYINIWGYANPDTESVIWTVLETVAAAYNTPALARAVNPPNLRGLGLSSEMKILYRWIYKGDGTFSERTDYRGSTTLPMAGGSTTPTAASVTAVPHGAIVGTTVQTQLEELETEKIPYSVFTAAQQELVSTGVGTVTTLLHKRDATTAPAVTDDSGDGYAVGSRWIDVTNDREYVCVDSTVGAAVWVEAGSGGNIDGGREDEVYGGSIVIDCGGA